MQKNINPSGMIFLRVTTSMPINLGSSVSPNKGCASSADAAASALQTWWFSFFWPINWGFVTNPWNFENPSRETLSFLDFGKGFVLGLNLCLKPDEGCAMKALVLGFEGRGRSPFDCRTACISPNPSLSLLSLTFSDFYLILGSERKKNGRYMNISMPLPLLHQREMELLILHKDKFWK